MSRHKPSLASILGVLAAALVGVASGPALSQAGMWTAETALPTARFALTAAAVNTTVYAIGGSAGGCAGLSNVDALDTVTGTWTPRAPMPTGRYHARAVTVNGIVYVLGGGSDCGPFYSTVEAYDPATDTWSIKAPMPTPRGAFSATAVSGKIYAIGGGDGVHAFTAVEEYDVATDTWATKTPMPTWRSTHAAVAIDGRIYLMGDITATLTSIDAYDPSTDLWTTKAAQFVGASAPGGAALDGKMYVMGGDTTTAASARLDAYDPVTDTIAQKASMLAPRAEFGVAVAGGEVYALGGFAAGVLSAVEEFTGPDTAPPVLSLPSPVVTDATTPAGAVVSYTVTATDNSGVAPTVVCTPPSGSTFPIGVTMVGCTATDAAGNSASGSFIVTVNGPAAQMASVLALVQSFNLAQGISNSLDVKVQNAAAAIGAASAGATASACSLMSAFINSVKAQSGKQLSMAQAELLITDANRIRATLGCP